MKNNTVTMPERDYNALKEKANAYDKGLNHIILYDTWTGEKRYEIYVTDEKVYKKAQAISEYRENSEKNMLKDRIEELCEIKKELAKRSNYYLLGLGLSIITILGLLIFN